MSESIAGDAMPVSGRRAALDGVVCTADVYQRPTRAPDYQAESVALSSLAQAIADSPETILQMLAEKTLVMLGCHSAGISLFADRGGRLHRTISAGFWSQHAVDHADHDFWPCDDMLDCTEPVLLRYPQRRDTDPQATVPPAVECLSVPFRVLGSAVGTIWAIFHDESRQFDAEDLRLLQSLSTCAAAACQVHDTWAHEISRRDAQMHSHAALKILNTELQTSEAALRRSEGDLRDFVENAAVGLHWVGADGTILWANQAELDLLGYEREEYVGRNIAEFHADRPVIVDILSRLAGGETLRDYGANLMAKDGSIRNVLISSNAFFEHDAFVHTRWFTRDVTNSTQAERVLRASEEASRDRDALYRSIIESSPDCIKVLDLAGNLLALYNGETLLGIGDLTPYLHRPWLDFWGGDHRQAAQDALSDALAGKEGRFVGFFRTLRNEEKWWDVRVSPIPGANGKPERLLAVSRDVTQRKLAELNFEFLASISDDLLRFTDVDEMMDTVGAKLGEFLGLSQCAFCEISETAETVVIAHDWHVDDAPSLIGVYRLADFVEEEFLRVARAGDTIVVGDVSADARTDAGKFAMLGIASFICVPLIREGAWLFALSLYKSFPYEWRTDEIELARELTARIWARLERLRAEVELGRSEARYRTLFEQMDEGYCVIEMIFHQNQRPIDFRYLEVNASFERESGLTQVRGKLASELMPDLEAHWLETYANVALTGQPIRYVNEASALDGRWFDLYAFRFGGENSRQVAVLFRNVKQQRIAAKALQESEERFRTLFDSMDEAFCIIEMIFDETLAPVDMRFLEVNPAFARQTGIRDAVGKRVRELAPGIEEYWIATYGQVSVTGEPVRFVNRVQDMNAWFDVYAFRMGAQEDRKVAVIFSNITERISTEHALREAAAEMVDLDHRKDEFLAMLGHELRNPLAPISNAVHLMRLQPEETPLSQQARVIIERQLAQLTRLVDDLLEVSRINTGKIQLREEVIAVGGVVERALDTVQPLLQQHRHEVTVSVPPTPIRVFADAARLEQVLVNLLTNAAKYTDDGGRIWLTVEEDGESAVVRVRDTGVGIAPELLPRIFDVFTQAQRTLDRSQGGLGIGLCLVKRLMELHHGSVTVTSELGKGSEFVVRLPLLNVTVPKTLLPVGVPLAPSVACCGVLVVDDNVDSARSLASLMQLLGHDVRLAYDGHGALEEALLYRPDLILLDIGLPGLTGFEVAERIRQNPALRDIVLIAMTGYGQEADRLRSRDSGFDHHIVKPADFDEVQRILATIGKTVTMTSAERGWPTPDLHDKLQ